MRHYLLFKNTCGRVALNEESSNEGLTYLRKSHLHSTMQHARVCSFATINTERSYTNRILQEVRD